MKLGDLPAISNAGIYIAIEKGYFQERGVTVDIERFASAGKMTAPLATGQIDVSVGSPSAGLFNAIAGGMDFKIVADKGQVRPGYNFTPLIVRKDLVDSGKVKTLKDLKGLKVANGAKGINFDYFLAKMMEHVGLGLRRPRRGLHVLSRRHQGAREQGGRRRLRARAVGRPGREGEDRHAAPPSPKRCPRSPRSRSPPSCTAASSSRSGPRWRARSCRPTCRASSSTTPGAASRTSEIAGILSKHLKLPVETIQATFPVYLDPSGKPRVQDLAAFQDWFHQMGWVKEKVAMDRVVDLSFLE